MRDENEGSALCLHCCPNALSGVVLFSLSVHNDGNTAQNGSELYAESIFHLEVSFSVLGGRYSLCVNISFAGGTAVDIILHS